MPSAENLDEIMMSCCHPIWMIDDGLSVGALTSTRYARPNLKKIDKIQKLTSRIGSNSSLNVLKIQMRKTPFFHTSQAQPLY